MKLRLEIKKMIFELEIKSIFIYVLFSAIFVG